MHDSNKHDKEREAGWTIAMNGDNGGGGGQHSHCARGAAIKEGKETAAKNRPHDLRATMNACKDRRRQHPLCLGLSQPVNPLAVVARLGACREAPGPSTASRFFDQGPEAAAQTSWLCQAQNVEVERIRLLRPAARQGPPSRGRRCLLSWGSMAGRAGGVAISDRLSLTACCGRMPARATRLAAAI